MLETRLLEPRFPELGVFEERLGVLRGAERAGALLLERRGGVDCCGDWRGAGAVLRLAAGADCRVEACGVLA